MKVAILHQDLEWVEEKMQKLFQERGAQATLHDVRTATVEDIAGSDLVMNRVYASVANRDYRDNLSTLSLLAALEAHGIPCLNSYATTQSDYSKAHAAHLLQQAGVETPATRKVVHVDEITGARAFAREQGYPIIVKPDMGGRGKGVQKVTNEAALVSALEQGLTDAGYGAGYIVQEFIPSVRDIDCRIAIIDGGFAFSYSRTLTSRNGETPWFASTSKGSQEGPYTPTQEEIAIARRASTAIGSLFNEMDICFADRGPVIIENNPTPNYTKGDSHDLKRLTKAVELIIKKYEMPLSSHSR